MKQNSSYPLFFTPKRLAYLGVLLAAEIVLSRFLSFSTPFMKIGFQFVPVALAGYWMGWIEAALLASLADFLGAILFPIGPYFPGFTLSAGLSGALLGWGAQNFPSMKTLLGSILIRQMIISFLLTTFWIHWLYHAPYTKILITRIGQCAGMVLVELVVTTLLLRMPAIQRERRRLRQESLCSTEQNRG